MIMQGQRMEAEIHVQLQTIGKLGTGRGGFSAPRPDIFTPTPEKDPFSIVQVAGWASWLVWANME
jgi:hypothetical protein